MRVFVTGGSGYIGSAVALRLKKAGHDVHALVRSEEKGKELKAAGVKPVIGDMADPAGYARAAYGAAAIVHLAAEMGPKRVELDKKTIANARELLRGSVGGTFIYTSGCFVIGPTGGKDADETCELQPHPIVAFRPAHEQLALQMAKDGIRSVVVRPGNVYGGANGGFGAELFGTALKHGAAQIAGEGTNAVPMVHVADLAELYVRMVERAPAGSIFHAADASRNTLHEIAEAASRAAGKDGKVQTLPLEKGSYEEAVALDQRLSSEKARNELDWRPRHESFVAEAPQLFAAWKAAQ